MTVKDEEFWGINGMGATGVHTLTNQIEHVDENTWLAMSIGMIAETAGVFADIKTAYEQMCEMLGPRCTVEVQQQAAALFDNIAKIHGAPLVPTYQLPFLKAIQKEHLTWKKETAPPTLNK